MCASGALSFLQTRSLHSKDSQTILSLSDQFFAKSSSWNRVGHSSSSLKSDRNRDSEMDSNAPPQFVVNVSEWTPFNGGVLQFRSLFFHFLSLTVFQFKELTNSNLLKSLFSRSSRRDRVPLVRTMHRTTRRYKIYRRRLTKSPALWRKT